MAEPRLSEHFQTRQPSVIRVSQIKFAQRKDDVQAVNVSIGNVSLQMYPAMADRMRNLGAAGSPFADNVVKYSATVGRAEANEAFLNVIASSGLDTRQLVSQITDGGSQAMELTVVGTCGPAGSSLRPLLLIDAAYTNYKAFASRLGRATVSVSRKLQDNGTFALPVMDEIEKVIIEHQPGAMLVIPYDNPTGQFHNRETMKQLAQLCVRHNLWLVSDEAYRELFYVAGEQVSSIWALSDKEVPGIEGRRISIETVSKVWNACGLRIGALVTDNVDFHERCVAENTAGLCSNVLGQYIVGALAQQSHQQLQSWFTEQRQYYYDMLVRCTSELRRLMPGLIVSSPDASIYSVVDVRDVTQPGFDALQFSLYCASQGKVNLGGENLTLLVAPMAGFYNVAKGEQNPGRTQMRIAFVETPDKMKHVPELFVDLLKQFEDLRGD